MLHNSYEISSKTHFWVWNRILNYETTDNDRPLVAKVWKTIFYIISMISKLLLNCVLKYYVIAIRVFVLYWIEWLNYFMPILMGSRDSEIGECPPVPNCFGGFTGGSFEPINCSAQWKVLSVERKVSTLHLLIEN